MQSREFEHSLLGISSGRTTIRFVATNLLDYVRSGRTSVPLLHHHDQLVLVAGSRFVALVQPRAMAGRTRGVESFSNRFPRWVAINPGAAPWSPRLTQRRILLLESMRLEHFDLG
jgi:hypothetical protein